MEIKNKTKFAFTFHETQSLAHFFFKKHVEITVPWSINCIEISLVNSLAGLFCFDRVVFVLNEKRSMKN